MSGAIGPGDWVRCVSAGAHPHATGHGWPAGEGLCEGAIYQVGDVWTDVGWPVLSIVGKERRESGAYYGRRVGYLVTRFVPLWRDASTQELARSTPVLEPA